jgi:predicted 3-demethylubiquinone-9 3-methyltransferase (glyoxalase superfamily)
MSVTADKNPCAVGAIGKFGLNWQIVLRMLSGALKDPDTACGWKP